MSRTKYLGIRIPRSGKSTRIKQLDVLMRKAWSLANEIDNMRKAELNKRKGKR